MARITEISEQKRNKRRVNIYLDGSFFCGLLLSTVVKTGLAVDAEMTESRLEKLQFESEREVAYDKSLTYVSKAMKTKKQVKEYLQGKGYLPQIVDYCIKKLTEYSFINDEEYCKSYVRTYKNSKGAKMIDRELKLKGIDFNLVEKAIDSEYDTAKETSEKLVRKYLKNKELTKENLAKAYKYLLSKGFSYEECSSAISALKGDEWNEF